MIFCDETGITVSTKLTVPKKIKEILELKHWKE